MKHGKTDRDYFRFDTDTDLKQHRNVEFDNVRRISDEHGMRIRQNDPDSIIILNLL